MTNKEAIEYLEKLYMQAEITDVYGDMDDTEPYDTAVDMAIKALEQPERKTGKWIWVDCVDGEGLGTNAWKCSVCDEIYSHPYHYCPNCGSYNGGEQDD